VRRGRRPDGVGAVVEEGKMKFIFISAGILSLLIGWQNCVLSQAECAWCSPGRCYTAAQCGHGCVCLKGARELHGRCVSLQ
jgi:hypothetical protein